MAVDRGLPGRVHRHAVHRVHPGRAGDVRPEDPAQSGGGVVEDARRRVPDADGDEARAEEAVADVEGVAVAAVGAAGRGADRADFQRLPGHHLRHAVYVLR